MNLNEDRRKVIEIMETIKSLEEIIISDATFLELQKQAEELAEFEDEETKEELKKITEKWENYLMTTYVTPIFSSYTVDEMKSMILSLNEEMFDEEERYFNFLYNDCFTSTYDQLLKENKFNILAKELNIKEIHVNDNDYQKVRDFFDITKLYSTWSVDSFFFEMLSEATINIGTNEKYDSKKECKMIDYKNGFLEFKDIAIDTMAKTYYPKGRFEGFVVPHEETITIAKYLEVKEGEEVIYRPTVLFIYSPCDYAISYLRGARIGKTNENINNTNKEVVRGFNYPQYSEILYRENIKNGTEYVGVLLLGSKFKPVWVGNRIKKNFLYKDKKTSFWQTPTITPVSMSALAAACWMIEHRREGGIYFPDDIKEYKDIISFAEKYISRTIYKTINKQTLERKLNINLNDLQIGDILL